MKMLVLEVLLLFFLWTTEAKPLLNPTEELDRLEQLEGKMKMMEAEMIDLKTLNAAKPKVAFSATLSNLQNGFKFIGPYALRTTLVYEYAFTNIGKAYNPSTGIFTAPLRGVYHFTFTLFHPIGPATQSPTGVCLKKNNMIVVSATDNAPGVDTEDTSGNSASLLLAKGDQVYVQLYENRRVYTDGNKRNSFSGHLLFPL